MENKIGVFSVFRTGELKSILLMILKHLTRYEIYLFMAYTNFVFVDILDWTTILGWFFFKDYGERAKYHCQGKRFDFRAFQAYCKDEIGRKESKISMPVMGVCDSEESLHTLYPRCKEMIRFEPIDMFSQFPPLNSMLRGPYEMGYYARGFKPYYGTTTNLNDCIWTFEVVDTRTKEPPRQLYRFWRLNCLGETYCHEEYGYIDFRNFIKKFSK
jgi:hypothetical protein